LSGKIKKAVEITDAKISFVSLVSKAANKKQVLVTKADGGTADVAAFGRILKTDAETHYVTGIVYEPMAEDTGGNFMTEDEIRKAAYWFSKNDGKNDIQHDFEAAPGLTVVESYIAPCDVTVGGEPVVKGTWLMTVEVTNTDIWDAVEKGSITGFSMGGVGKYGTEDVPLDKVNKQEGAEPLTAPQRKGILKGLLSALGFDAVEKGAVADAFKETGKRGKFWDAFSALHGVLYQYDWNTDAAIFESDENVIRAALSEFSEILIEILTDDEQSVVKSLASASPVVKAGKKISGANKQKLDEAYQLLTELREAFEEAEPIEKENHEMTSEDIKKTVEEVVTKAVGEAVAEAVKKMTPTAADPAPPAETPPPAETTEPVTKGDITKMIEDSVNEAVAKAMTPLLKSVALPTNLNGEQTVEKSGEHFLTGIL
jgi:hypothetical protein